VRFVDYLALVRQRLALVAAVVGTVALISLGLSYQKQPIYESQVRLRAMPIAPNAIGSSLAEVLQDAPISYTSPGTEAVLVQSVDVAARVAERLGLAIPPSALVKQVSVVGIPDTTVLVLTAQAMDGPGAVQLANAFADAYLELRREDANQALDRAGERLGRRLQEVQGRLAEANTRLQSAPPGSVAATDAAAQRDLALLDLNMIRADLRDLSDREALEGGFGEVILPATEFRLLRDVSPTRSLVFGVLLGVPVALAVVLLLDSLSQTVRSKEDAESVTGSEVIGLVPATTRGRRSRFGGLTVDTAPFSAAAESYRTLSVNLATAADAVGARRVLVTSPISGEGKSTTTANVAVCNAERGTAVTLVDGDLRRPVAHDLFGIEAAPGLTELLTGDATPRRAVQAVRPNLSVVTAGTAVERPDQLLNRSGIAGVLDRLSKSSSPRRKASDASRAARDDGLVLVDSAPVLQAAETLALAQAVDAVVLVLRAGVTRKAAAVRAVEQVRRSGAVLLGAILVGVSEGEELGLTGSYTSPSPRLVALGADTARTVT